MNVRDELIEWLRDAYAMERGLEITLKKQAENEELGELMRSQAATHLEETKSHATAVQSCLERLGSDVSTIKSAVGQATESVKGMGTMFARDQRVKDLLAAYASEHFEIACYQALRTTAELAGESEIVAVCDTIIPDEERMADWLKINLPEVVRGYLSEQEATA